MAAFHFDGSPACTGSGRYDYAYDGAEPVNNIQVDDDGELRCWSCGGRHFTEKRTFRAKAIGVTAAMTTVGIAAAGILGTKKKLRCKLCGVYNDVGSADPYVPKRAKPSARQPVARLAVDEPIFGTAFVDPNGHLDADEIRRRTQRPPFDPKSVPADPGSTRAGQFLEMKSARRPGSR